MSIAQNLLTLARNTDLALRQGRLGATEWFLFLNKIEELANRLQQSERENNASPPLPAANANNSKTQKSLTQKSLHIRRES